MVELVAAGRGVPRREALTKAGAQFHPARPPSPVSDSKCQTAHLRSLDGAQRNPGFPIADSPPDFASLHPGYGHTSSPRVHSGPRACRLFLFLLLRRGVRNDRAFHRARGATWVTTWPHVLSRHMTPCTGGTAHGKLPCGSCCERSAYACVPHANGFRGLLHVPGGVTGADTFPFVRAVARTCTWAVRPCCRRLSLVRLQDQ